MESILNREELVDNLGLVATMKEVEIGGVYPVYGVITRVIESLDGTVEVEINHDIKVEMSVQDSSKLDLIKSRAFEAGIFVSEVVSVEPQLRIKCSAVIFGKSNSFQA